MRSADTVIRKIRRRVGGRDSRDLFLCNAVEREPSLGRLSLFGIYARREREFEYRIDPLYYNHLGARMRDERGARKLSIGARRWAFFFCEIPARQKGMSRISMNSPRPLPSCVYPLTIGCERIILVRHALK